VERVASPGVLRESRLDGILANTAASADCMTSDVAIIRRELVQSVVGLRNRLRYCWLRPTI